MTLNNSAANREKYLLSSVVGVGEKSSADVLKLKDMFSVVAHSHVSVLHI